MIPSEWGPRQLVNLTMGGQSLDWSSENIKGVEYAFATPLSSAGRIVATYAFPQSADIDGDWDVDGDDLAAWKTAFPADVTGDADSDGDADGADFLLWQQQLSPNHTTSTQGVPEPESLALLGPVAIMFRGKRRLPCDRRSKTNPQTRKS